VPVCRPHRTLQGAYGPRRLPHRPPDTDLIDRPVRLSVAGRRPDDAAHLGPVEWVVL